MFRYAISPPFTIRFLNFLMWCYLSRVMLLETEECIWEKNRKFHIQHARYFHSATDVEREGSIKQKILINFISCFLEKMKIAVLFAGNYFTQSFPTNSTFSAFKVCGINVFDHFSFPFHFTFMELTQLK